MEILVTGANGFVGRHLVMALQKRGDTIRALSSPAGDTTWLEEHDVRVFRGDICKQGTLTEPMRGVDAVVHLAAETRQKWGMMQGSYLVNVTGTENVCRAALAAGVRRFVHVSTSAIYNMRVGRPVTEDDLPQPLIDDPYCFTKAQGDYVVQRMMREEGLPAVVLRPGALLGPGDPINIGSLVKRVRGGNIILVGSGTNAIPLVYVTDLVQALLLALDSEQAKGHIYNISNDQFLTQKQYMSAIAEEIGVSPRYISTPYSLMYVAAYIAERISTLSGYRIPPVLSRHRVQILGEDGRLSTVKARNELGYVPQVSIREAVRLTISWYQQQGALIGEKESITSSR